MGKPQTTTTRARNTKAAPAPATTPAPVAVLQPARTGYRGGVGVLLSSLATPAPAPVLQPAPAPVAATPAPATPAQAATRTKAPATGALSGAVLLPLTPGQGGHGTAIYAAALTYPTGPGAAAQAGAALAYVTGACSKLGCYATGYNPKAAGAYKGQPVAVWYNPATGQALNAMGAAMAPGLPGPHNGHTAQGVAGAWAAISRAVQAYHTAQGGACPAWAAPAPAQG